jgi:hypothetical protein
MTKTNINDICDEIYNNCVKAGWYTDVKTGQSLVGSRNVPEMLMLMVSEISEAMEGYRKNLKDDKLPQYSAVSVELADLFIRMGDLVGYLKAIGYDSMEDFDKIIEEKRLYNAQRSDHKMENRKAGGGKQF